MTRVSYGRDSCNNRLGLILLDIFFIPLLEFRVGISHITNIPNPIVDNKYSNNEVLVRVPQWNGWT
jgi:hypothetical protein